MARNPERSAKTRQDIVTTARRLFGKEGYTSVSTPQIADASGVSRGAMYHHFRDKAAILEAVIEAEFAHIAGIIDTSATGSQDPVENLVEGGEAFLTAMSDPVTRQLLLIDGPAVLGTQRMTDLDTCTTTQTLAEGITAAKTAGRLPADTDTAALTSLMSGAYDRAAIDGFGHDAARQLEMRQAIRAIWFGLSRLS
ncbi:TetR/AcrR family transcriptional regulator [Henriciella pelagia]|uniref:TetR/AcrR family transcriptional regulator n=1 Tax=Henriciella pelagia TaxID=1977912 RepID=UPI0035127FD8